MSDTTSSWRAPHLTDYDTQLRETLLSLEMYLGSQFGQSVVPLGEQPMGRIFTGSVDPGGSATADAQPGDIYVHKLTGDVFVLSGTPTFPGALVTSHGAAPTGGAGGDLHVQVDVGDLWWENAVRTTGLQWWTGTGNPAPVGAEVGDRFVDVSTANEHVLGG